ncbi:hypothetical protein GCK32_007135 [Trichostrongylus colubriformis]|uniref:FAD/NAD(P)-binding domain-containing protein n=1 Tax=Trichostrongylus colubriformis TaxID=6319 RepID=A0AAN8F4Q5_TRICO
MKFLQKLTVFIAPLTFLIWTLTQSSSFVKESNGYLILTTTEKQLEKAKRTRQCFFNAPSKDDPIIVVGGGISAATFMEHVRLNGCRTPITMITQEDWPPYDRVLLSKKPSIEGKDLRLRSDEYYKENHINVITKTRVHHVDTHRRSIALSTGKRMRYSKLVLALGVMPKRLTIPGADLQNVFYLRAASEANAVSKQSIGKHVVCIGGSFIGMEIASALVLATASVTVICMTEEPLPALGSDIGAAVRKRFETKGVRVIVNSSVKRISGDSEVDSVVLSTGDILEANVVVVGIGAEPATKWLRDTEVEMDSNGFIKVDRNFKVLQNDKVRAITWSESRPDLLAIQYFQHPTEFRSIEGGAENTGVGHLDVSLVPSWVSAAPVGTSFAKGGRMATHYREWDDAKQMWHYSVEVKKLPVDDALYQSAIGLQNAQDSNEIGSYCEDRAHATNDRNLQILWTFLAALSNKQGRREFIRILGFGDNEQQPMSRKSRESKTSVTSNEVTQLTNIMSSMNYSSPRQNGTGAHLDSDDDSSNAEVFARQPDLDWNQFDANAWSMMDALVGDGEEEVIDRLLDHKDYATAFMFARDNANLTHRVTERYIAEQLSASQRLLSLVATGSFEQLIETFPSEQWSRLLALILARTDRAQLVHIMRKIAAKWRLLALRHDLFLICGGEERTMSKEPEKPRFGHVHAINNALHPSRVQQQKPIFSPSSTAATSSPSAFSQHSQHRQPYTAPQHPGMPPMPPAFSGQTYTNYAPAPPQPRPPPIPGYQQTSVLGYAPTPPPPAIPGPPTVPGFQQSANASMYGQQPVVPGFNPIQTPIPPPPVAPAQFSNVPSSNYSYTTYRQSSYAPSPATVPAQEYSSKSSTISPVGGAAGDPKELPTHGWNDPPPLAAHRPTPPPAPVFEVNWKPLEQPAVTLPNGLPGVASGAPMRPSSSASTHQQQEHREIPQVALSPEDQSIMDRFHQLINSILAVNRTPIAQHKAEEAKTRLGCELAPRLAAGKLSMGTRQLLWQCSEQASYGNYRAAVATCGQMVRSGGDFVEVKIF